MFLGRRRPWPRLLGVETAAAWSPATLTAVQGVPVAAIRTAVAQRLKGSRPASVGEEAWQHTTRLYRRFGETPLWLTADGVAKDRAGALTHAVLGANADALKLDEYPISELANALVSLRRASQPTAEQLAEADVLLTATYASLGEDLLAGQVDPKSVAQSWHIDPQDENVDSALVRTLTRLPLEQAIAAAVAQLQARHAIVVDSALGSETLDALNVSADYRLGQIAANLERHRWMPRSLGTRYVSVNVPAFHLKAYDAGKKALEMKVIVGQEYEDKATPVFSDSMETVVFRPYWNITPDIQRKEIEPAIARDPG